jgi:hypothetical protein
MTDKKGKKQINIYLDADLRRKIEEECQRQGGRSKSNFIVNVLIEHFRKTGT